MTTPTQRTLRALRGQGRVVDIVERWIPAPPPRGGFRRDLFQCFDIIALEPGRGIVGVQSCGQAFSEHWRKLTDGEGTANMIEWLKAGGHAELWGWRKVKVKRGGKAVRWEPRIKTITMEDLR